MSNEPMTEADLPIVCDPSGISDEEMEYWVNQIVPRLYRAVQEIRELPNGYAWRLPSEAEVLTLLAEDLNMERLCCPFIRYTLEIEPNHGPFWLRMTGGTGVKEFLRTTFETVNLFDVEVARAAGFDVSAQDEVDSVETALEMVDRINAAAKGER